ncbi:MAG: hypothetical protein FWC28_00470 [Proteobacteria bacterium]|nr:hypothetical protein [Pseudomonadota bacterium]
MKKTKGAPAKASAKKAASKPQSLARKAPKHSKKTVAKQPLKANKPGNSKTKPTKPVLKKTTASKKPAKRNATRRVK